MELGDYQCYARLSSAVNDCRLFTCGWTRRQSPTSVVRDLVAARFGTRYGRDAAVVADDRAAMLERLEVQAWSESSHAGGRSNTDPEGGRIPPALGGTMGPPPSSDRQKRNQQRPARLSRPVVCLVGRSSSWTQHNRPGRLRTGEPDTVRRGRADKDEVA